MRIRKTIPMLAAGVLLISACSGAGTGGDANSADSGSTDTATEESGDAEDSGDSEDAGAEGGGASGDMVIGSFGADYDRFLTESVDLEFLDKNPDVNIIYDSGDPNALMTKLRAEKDGTGSYDVVQLTAQDVPTLVEAGVLEELDTSKIDRWDNILDGFEDSHCIPHIWSPISFIYNADKLPEPPKTWGEFFTDDILNQAGTGSQVWYTYVFFGAAVDAAGGDPGTDWEPGYDTALDAAPKLRDYGSTEQIGQGLMSGEMNLVPGPRARAAHWSNASGMNIRSYIPEDGTFGYVSATCIPANAPNKDAAYEYLNAALQPGPQEYFAENMFYAPTVDDVVLEDDLMDQVGVTDEELLRIIPVDWGSQVEPAAERRDLWNRSVGN